MSDITYISDDVNVHIDQSEPLDVDVRDIGEPIEANVEAVTYISDDVNVRIEEPDSIDAIIDAGNTVEARLDDVTINRITEGGNLPPGGNPGNLLIKYSTEDYKAEWKAIEEAGFRHIYYDTTANWDLQRELISEEGAIYIYSDYYQGGGTVTPAAKIGDGLAYLIDLPTTSDMFVNRLYAHIWDTDSHVSAYDREFWNNKVTSVLDHSDAENLVLTKEFL